MTIAQSPVLTIRVADIEPSPLNPRHTKSVAYGEDKLRELGDSMLSATGQLEAVLVRPRVGHAGKYELVNGERRWRAAKFVGMVELAARVRAMSDSEALDIMLACGSGANVEPLTAIEAAEGYDRLMKLRGFDQKQLAEHLGVSVFVVHRRLALLNLPDNARKAHEAGELSATTAWHIARIPGADAREKAAEQILNSELHGGVMPKRAAAEWIETTICRTLKGAPFDTKDATLVPDAGPCETCRFRSGNNPEEYGDIGDKQKCMHPACFEQKLAAQRARVLAEEAKEGKIALSPEENAAVFKPGEHGLAFDSEFVRYNERPTPDLLKKEVSSAPTWRALCAARGVQVYVGIDQDGRAVDLVRLSEAFAAVSEPTLFNEDTVRRYGMAMEAAILRLAAKGRPAEDIAAEKHLPLEHVRAVMARGKPARKKTAERDEDDGRDDVDGSDDSGRDDGDDSAEVPAGGSAPDESQTATDETELNGMLDLLVDAHRDWKEAPAVWLIATEAVLRRHDRLDEGE